MSIDHKNRLCSTPDIEHKYVRIVDTTLRDGEQAPGVVFSSTEKIEIAVLLARAGVDEIEAGIPAMGSDACTQIKSMVDLKLPCILTSWCRAVKKDIEIAAQCRTPGVHISFPTSQILLKTFDKNERWVLSELEDMVSCARLYFDRVSVGAQDATRTDPKFLIRFVQAAKGLGVDSLRLADTVGQITPVAVMEHINKIVTAVPDISLEFHGHNDLGMATGNAVSAVDAGVESLSVTVNGLGERAGNVPLEEVSVALFGVGNYLGNINLAQLPELCRKVAVASGQDIAVSKPIVGKRVFCHESGIHCAALLKNPLSYQPFEPGLLGDCQPEFVFGVHSGRAGIHRALLSQGVNVTREETEKMTALVKQKSRLKKGSFSCLDLKDLYLDECV